MYEQIEQKHTSRNKGQRHTSEAYEANRRDAYTDHERQTEQRHTSEV
jgi:hypothetical protein